MATDLKTNIVILGAGIGGYEAFRTLSYLLKIHGLNKKITIIDKNNYFTFTPLLHEVASGSVEPSHSAIPLREFIYKSPHTFIKASVLSIEPDKKTVKTTAGEISYEYCIAALGSGVNYYNTPGAQKNSYSVRTLPEATLIHEDLIKNMESCADPLAVTIVGGGYTGAEVAGQLAYLANHDLKKLYPTKTITISLVQAGPSLVPSLPEKGRQKIAKRLSKMGVKLYFNSKAKEVKEKSIVLQDEKEIRSDMTIWCAGVGNIAASVLPEQYVKNGRIPVTHYLNHSKEKTLYGVGDIILGNNQSDGEVYPQLGEAAHHEGRYVANHIVSLLLNKKIKPFYFKSKGLLMPIGDRYGIASFNNLVVSGLFVWWLRRTVYLLFMPGYLRKIKIVLDWTLLLFGFRYIIGIERSESKEQRVKNKE